MSDHRDRLASAILFSGAAMGAACPAVAGGFFNDNQSATAAGAAVAGETASAANAATVFYNPAGMTFLDRPELLVGAGLLIPSTGFQNRGTTDAVGLPVAGSTDTNDSLGMQPLIFGTTPISDGFALGLGVFVPFGQQTKYADDWVGRYQVQQVSLRTVDVRPAVAYRVNRWLSLGAGLDVEYLDFDRANAIDFGSLLPSPFATPGGADGRLSVALDGWGVGYDLGILIAPTPALHLGVNFRSGIHNSLSGSAVFNVPTTIAPLVTAGGKFQNTTANATVNLPEIVSLGLSYRVDERWTALFELSWMQWSELQQLALNFANATPQVAQTLNWHDSIRAAVGAVYRLTEVTDLRAGFAYDETPVPDQFRTADLPEADIVSFAVGVTQRLSERLSLTLSYSFNHAMSAPLNVTAAGAGTVAGTASQDEHAVGIEARIRF